MRRFLLDGTILEEGDEGFQDLLIRAYRGKVRPLCLCCDPPVPMYVTDIGDQLVIKRMPLSGGKHDPACPSYEPPYELSGLGPLMGEARRGLKIKRQRRVNRQREERDQEIVPARAAAFPLA
jgi:hypothetical protein